MKIDLDLGDTQLILKECREYGLSKSQTAYVMATAWWETAHTVKPVKEGFWIRNAEAWRRKTLRYWPWYGRGYVQLTWKANYEKAGKKLGLDLTTDADVVMQPRVAAKILVLGSLEGWFTGKKLGDYINDNETDFVGARRIINGNDKAYKIANVALEYKGALPDDKPIEKLKPKPKPKPKPQRSTWWSVIQSLFNHDGKWPN